MTERELLLLAIEKSAESVQAGAFPVGAVIARGGEVIATAISDGKRLQDPTSHAETAAIRLACQKLGKRELKDVVLYSSLEPCLMCFSASSWASVPRVVYACPREKVSPIHYEGGHDLRQIDDALRHPIELVQLAELESQALAVITSWEAAQLAKQDN